MTRHLLPQDHIETERDLDNFFTAVDEPPLVTTSRYGTTIISWD